MYMTVSTAVDQAQQPTRRLLQTQYTISFNYTRMSILDSHPNYYPLTIVLAN